MLAAAACAFIVATYFFGYWAFKVCYLTGCGVFICNHACSIETLADLLWAIAMTWIAFAGFAFLLIAIF